MDLLSMGTNRIWGVGYESFWLGQRLDVLWGRYWWQPNQAHNGYLEIYLNLGLAGLFIASAFLIAAYRKGRVELLRNFEHGRMRLGFLAGFILFNWTEAGLRPMGPMLFILYTIAIDYPTAERISHSRSVVVEPEKETLRWRKPHGWAARGVVASVGKVRRLGAVRRPGRVAHGGMSLKINSRRFRRHT
jgi:hypothetical protein